MVNTKAGIIASLILTAAIATGSVNAASGDKINKVINVSATIPSGTFTIEPTYGAWPTDISLPYDTVSQTFNPYSLRLEATTAVGLTASLQQEAAMVSGTNKIPLVVKVQGEALGATPVGVVGNSAGNSSQTHIVDLEIETTGTHTAVGLYAGVVNMVFEDNF
ncbi:CS1 type fimbrial major subunit [Vibrio bivalvicida]|uniref:Adhesin n=1 Tax=Vibrio bivalvicida TaxID=1276888 RepID=A0A177Y1E9_9VIBR|nr:CS1 type fimbrial major subunit [Vibrio bivalvicida]OAJ94699.1 hypothetical protein APB76_05290 [Vibrio bivalvicida]